MAKDNNDPAADAAAKEAAEKAEADAAAKEAADKAEADAAAKEAAANQGADDGSVDSSGEEPDEEPEDIAAACAELGIEPDAEGKVELELLVSLAGEQVKVRGDSHGCDAAEAVRMVRAGYAKIR